MKIFISSLVVGAAVVLASAGVARADIAAVWAEGHGGLASSSAESAGDASMGGLGFQLGGRLFIFEGYFDRTSFGQGAAVNRAIFGLRGGFGSDNLRLVLRGGLGVVGEEGGALTGRMPGAPDRRGAVARAGISIEKRMATALLAGFGVDGERFALPANGTLSGGTISGSDIFASLRLLFELGV